MDTLGARVAHLAHLAGLSYKAIDALCGFGEPGSRTNHTGQIARGALADPRGSTLVRLARALGATAEYLIDGPGAGHPAPTVEEVRAAVERAKRRRRHATKVTQNPAPCKVNVRPTDRRSVGAGRATSGAAR